MDDIEKVLKNIEESLDSIEETTREMVENIERAINILIELNKDKEKANIYEELGNITYEDPDNSGHYIKHKIGGKNEL